MVRQDVVIDRSSGRLIMKNISDRKVDLNED